MSLNKRCSSVYESFIANLNTIFESWTEEGWKDDGKPDFPERKSALTLIISDINGFISRMANAYPNLSYLLSNQISNQNMQGISFDEILNTLNICEDELVAEFLRELPRSSTYDHSKEWEQNRSLNQELKSLRKKIRRYRTGQVKDEIRLDDEPQQEEMA